MVDRLCVQQLARIVKYQFTLGQPAAKASGLHHQPPVNLAGVSLVRVPADDDGVGRVQAFGHVDATALQTRAGIRGVGGGTVVHGAFMHDCYQHLGALGAQLRYQSVQRISLIGEPHTNNAFWYDDLGRVARHGANKSDFQATHFFDDVAG